MPCKAVNFETHFNLGYQNTLIMLFERVIVLENMMIFDDDVLTFILFEDYSFICTTLKLFMFVQVRFKLYSTIS